MTSPALLLLVPLLGVSFGYEPSTDADEGYDYTVQVEPELLEQMQRGNADSIEANIPAEVAPIRRIRIVVGSDPLPKTLRPGTTARTTYRQDLDAAAGSGVELLAQTGPAGGFGRNATGFNGAATRASTPPTTTPPPTTPPPTTPPTTVPAIGSNYTPPPATNYTGAYDIRGQLDAGFQAAENGLNNTRSAVQGSLNSVGGTTQQMLDGTRQTVSDFVAPPENRSFDRQNTPLENLSGGVQDEFRNTTNAMRDSIDRASVAARQAFDTNRYDVASQPNASQPAANPSAPAWDNGSSSNPYRPDERSVLNRSEATSVPPATGMTDAEREYWAQQQQRQQQRDQQLRDEQFRDMQARQQATSIASQNGPAFPTPPLQTLPSRQQPGSQQPNPQQPNPQQPNPQQPNPQQPSVVQPLVERTRVNSSDLSFGAVGTPTIADTGQFGDPYDRALNNPAARDNFLTGDSAPGADLNMPAITSTSATTQTTGRPNVDSWATDSQSEQVSDETRSQKSTGLPAGVWAWAIALGLGVVNLFQWLNIVDMRNKYRVALRRSSPNFARSMAA